MPDLHEGFVGDETGWVHVGYLVEPPPSPPKPTPVERALDILGPHLRDQPLYRTTA